MAKIVYFTTKDGKPDVVRFVKYYQKSGFLRREKIGYSLSGMESNVYLDVEGFQSEKCVKRVRKDYPEANVEMCTYDEFIGKHIGNRFWVICRYRDGYEVEYYSDMDSNGKPTYTTDTDDVRLILAESSAKETLRTIQNATRDRVWVQQVFVTLKNELLSPVFMIVCTSREKENVRYFTKLDGNRIRSCTTSDAAAKFNYEDVMIMFEKLHSTNKNFSFAVLPVFKENVNCKNIEAYMKANKISRMVQMDCKLRFLNR